VGGDVDTVAPIALGAASCCAEHRRDIPERLVQTLENGRLGRDHIIDLDRRLMALIER
jgi:hypothetical protein